MNKQPTAKSMIHPFFFPWGVSFSPWTSNVLQMKGIYNTSTSNYWSSQILEL